MRHSWIGLLILVLVACGGEEETVVQPTATATTPPFLQNYQGPLIGGLASGEDSSSACSADSGCAVQPAPVVELDPAPRPLTSQIIDEIEVGIPEGYSPLILEDEILITATDVESIGGFIFSLRLPKEDELETLLAKFDNPAFEEGKIIKNPDWEAKWIDIADGGLVLLQAPDLPTIFIESFTDQGYWPAFEATFQTMVEALRST